MTVLIKLGNLTVQQFMERVGAEATPEEITLLESYRTDTAENHDPRKFHIFKDPAISIHIGSAALREVGPVFARINGRRAFNREVTFYPIDREDQEAATAEGQRLAGEESER